MPDRPYILLSCGMSIDGYLDNASSQRLLLSNQDDLERVDAVRAASDAILVGARTVRQDNPRLVVRSERGRDERVSRGLPPTPTKVTVTEGARLDPRARFFSTGETDKLVYCARPAADPDQGDGHRRRPPRPAGTVLLHGRDRQARVLRAAGRRGCP